MRSEGGRAVWVATEASDWCGRFDPTVRARGQSQKFTDEQVLEAVRVVDTTVGSEGKSVARMAMKRTDLIWTLMDLGITHTPALRRIEKLVRQGRLAMGKNPWPRPYPTPGIYVWLGEAEKAALPAPANEAHPEATFLDLVRLTVPDQASAMSLRSIVREIEHTMPISLTTASRKMAALVDSGLVVKSEAGYYAAPTQVEI